MIRKRKTFVAKRVTPKAMTGIPKAFGILNDPLGNQIESELMEKEETEQRKCDRFWGQDKDLHDRELERKLMSVEDELSFKNEQWYEKVLLHQRWDEEYQRSAWNESKVKAKQNDQERKNYLKFINSSLSSDEVIGFVWGEPSETASLRQDLPLADDIRHGMIDASEIGKEVSLSLPSTVGALHLSVHLEGLQQSRAIIDKASLSYQQTLRRINSQSAEDGEASQPFKQNPLAAAILKKKGGGAASQSEGVASSGNFAHSRLLSAATDVSATADAIAAATSNQSAVPPHMPLLDGHPQHRWDQELMLQMAFISLDRGNKGYLKQEEVAAVSYEGSVHALLKYTVFWAYIKKRNWSFFEKMSRHGKLRSTPPNASNASNADHHLTALGAIDGAAAGTSTGRGAGSQQGPLDGRGGRSSSSRAGITVQDWLAAARSLANEAGVPLRHIRTEAEHLQLSTPSAAGSTSTHDKGVGAANVFSGLAEREHRLSRSLKEGDCVWALHAGGVLWLPAVVKAVHPNPSISNAGEGSTGGSTFGENEDDEGRGRRGEEEAKRRAAGIIPAHDTVSYSGYRYDLWYPLSQKELQHSRALMSSRQLLSLPSQQQLEQKSLLQPRPFDEERSVCSFAFDLVDGAGAGIVPLKRLIDCLQSFEFSRMVETSLALSTIFHNGNHVAATYVHSGGSSSGSSSSGNQEASSSSSARTAGTTTTAAAAAAAAAKKKFVSVGCADIPCLLPVFIDTFSAPTEEDEEEEEEEEQDEEGKDQVVDQVKVDQPEGVSVAENQNEANFEEEKKNTKKKKKKKSKNKEEEEEGESEGVKQPQRDPSAPDWISKLDFLEFCQAVVDIKRYSVSSAV